MILWAWYQIRFVMACAVLMGCLENYVSIIDYKGIFSLLFTNKGRTSIECASFICTSTFIGMPYLIFLSGHVSPYCKCGQA